MRRFTLLLLAAVMLPFPAWAPTPVEMIAEANKEAVVFLLITGTDANGVPKQATATGFLVSSMGHVITAKHIFNPVTQPNIQGALGSRYEPLREMEERARDPDADVLLLQFKGSTTGYQTVCLGASIDVGAELVAIGFPEGSDRSIIKGVLSNTSGSGGLWQTDTPFIQGYSGAPVFGPDGQVVGIVAGGTPDVEGRNFFTPLHDASYLLTKLPEWVSASSRAVCGQPVNTPGTVVSAYGTNGAFLGDGYGDLCPGKRELLKDRSVEIRPGLYKDMGIAEKGNVIIENVKSHMTVERPVVKITPLESGEERDQCVIAMHLETRRHLQLPANISDIYSRRGHVIKLTLIGEK